MSWAIEPILYISQEHAAIDTHTRDNPWGWIMRNMTVSSWRHDTGTLSALLAVFDGNLTFIGGFLSQKIENLMYSLLWTWIICCTCNYWSDWNYLSISKLQRLLRWSNPTLYDGYNCLSVLRLMLIHVSKRGLRWPLFGMGGAYQKVSYNRAYSDRNFISSLKYLRSYNRTKQPYWCRHNPDCYSYFLWWRKLETSWNFFRMAI